MAALLSIMPVVFWAFLKFNKIPATAKAAVCSACIESRYYWVVIALLFRFLITVVFATARDFPSVTAFVADLLRALACFADDAAAYVELHTCLIVQFALQILVRDSECLGVAVGTAAQTQFAQQLSTPLEYAESYLAWGGLLRA